MILFGNIRLVKCIALYLLSQLLSLQIIFLPPFLTVLILPLVSYENCSLFASDLTVTPLDFIFLFIFDLFLLDCLEIIY